MIGVPTYPTNNEAARQSSIAISGKKKECLINNNRVMAIPIGAEQQNQISTSNLKINFGCNKY